MSSLLIFIGWAGALFMGFILGAIGGGGALLTIPILVGIFHLRTIEAASALYWILLLGASLTWNMQLQLPWLHLWIFILLAITGALIGGILSKKWEDQKLKQGFSLILLLVGIGMTIKEIIVSI